MAEWVGLSYTKKVGGERKRGGEGKKGNSVGGKGIGNIHYRFFEFGFFGFPDWNLFPQSQGKRGKRGEVQETGLKGTTIK